MRGGATGGFEWVEARDGAKHVSTMHSTAPTTKNYPAQDVTSANP